MTPRTINVLHIEDDVMQRMSLAHHLAEMQEFQFAITCVDSEDAAIAAFARGGADLVILDYQLTQGNGLSCLHKLRERDAMVPIVAVSGVATPEIAADLLQAGADEYFDKHQLDKHSLARSIRHVLARTASLRLGALAASPSADQVEALFRQVCTTFRACVTPEFFRQLDALETAARLARFTPEQLQGLLEDVWQKMEATDPAVKPQLRPILLEICVRLFGIGSARSSVRSGP